MIFSTIKKYFSISEFDYENVRVSLSDRESF